MRFMVIVKATPASEAGVLPSEKLIAEMGRYNEELAEAGLLLAGEGLQPSSKGARVRFSGEKRIVIDGPFAETKELIAGFWLKDKFGLSWQIVPTALAEILQDEDPAKAERVMSALLQMKKLDINALRQAREL